MTPDAGKKEPQDALEKCCQLFERSGLRGAWCKMRFSCTHFQEIALRSMILDALALSIVFFGSPEPVFFAIFPCFACRLIVARQSFAAVSSFSIMSLAFHGMLFKR
jgi:hypothetical protein